jgi:hypothetical protein
MIFRIAVSPSILVLTQSRSDTPATAAVGGGGVSAPASQYTLCLTLLYVMSIARHIIHPDFDFSTYHSFISCSSTQHFRSSIVVSMPDKWSQQCFWCSRTSILNGFITCGVKTQQRALYDRALNRSPLHDP